MSVDYAKIATDIMGTSKTESTIVEEYGLDIDENDFLDIMSGYNIEFCDGCGTWLETCEMSEDKPDVCKRCNDEDDDEE